MRHFTFAQSDQYPVALLIKGSSFDRREIKGTYIDRLAKHHIPADDVIVLAAEYNAAGKATAPWIKQQLDELLPAMASVGTRYLYCADANYFKILTKSGKAEPHLGYVLPCKIEGYANLQVILGVNHRSLMYNPANEAKLDLSVATLISCVSGNYQELGSGVIKFAEYPSTLHDISQWLQKLQDYPFLSCDTETFSLKHDKAGIGTISFCWNEHEGIAFACDYRKLDDGPVDGNYGVYHPNLEVRAMLRAFFEGFRGTLRFHNSPFDMKVMIAALWMKDLNDTEGLLHGLSVLSQDFEDTKVITYLATNTTAGNSLRLKDLAHEHAGNWAHDDIADIRRIPLQDLLTYNLVDGLSTNYVFDKYYPIMVQDNQETLYHTMMLPSQVVITQTELTGMPLNPRRVAEVKAELQAISDKHVATLQNMSVIQQVEDFLTERNWEEDYIDRRNKAKNPEKIKPKERSTYPRHTFNPNSSLQCQVLLYQQMGLPVIDYTETKQPSCAGDTLEKLLNHTDNPDYKAVIEALLGYAEVNKILTSFIPAFEQAIEKGDGVTWLHGSFNLGGTKSGRLSSSDPNLQQIPAGTSGNKNKQYYGKLVKSCFEAPEGWLFCGADFNSLEDYVSALTTKDPNKLKVYTGHRVFEVKIGEITQTIRDDAVIRYQGKEYTGEEFYKAFGTL